MADNTAIRPFHFEAPQADLVDLRNRIKATKWPEREQVTDASQGVQLATMQKLAQYWAHDWRKCEAKIDAVPNFITEIDGLDIHFIHVRSKHDNALPMIVTHGWPGWKPIHCGAAKLSCVYDSAPRGSPRLRTLIIPPTMVNLPDPDVPAGVVSWVRNRHAAGATLVSLCSGAFILAETGLVDGLSVATHQICAEALAAQSDSGDERSRIVEK